VQVLSVIGKLAKNKSC